MTASKRRVLHAMEDGKITRVEAEAYLNATHDTSLKKIESRRHAVAYTIILAMVAVIVAGVWLLPGGLTGYVTYEIPEEAHNITNGTIPIIGNVTGLSLTGTMQGDGTATVMFRSNGTNYTVVTIASDTGAPRTSKPSYTPGENITMDNVQNATYYIDDGEMTVSVGMPLEAPAEGVYDILVIQNDSGTLESTRVPLIVNTTPVERTTTFTNVCEQTCVLQGIVNGTLEIVTNGTILNLTLIDVEMGGVNLPPVVSAMPDMTLTEETTIHMDEYFSDPEGQYLFFSTSQSEKVLVEKSGSLLTLTPLEMGTELFIVYASDLEHLVESRFTIVVAGEATVENITVNTTENVSVNITTPVLTNTTQNVTEIPESLCDHPNPNERPIECLQENAEEFFPFEAIYWENDLRTKAGRFNQLGNLQILGDVIEHSKGFPGENDFALGNVNRDGRLDATIWVDADGNLHLQGMLHEELTEMTPPPGSYSILSRRSIYLAYANLATGDLYLRGNLIPYRRSIS